MEKGKEFQRKKEHSDHQTKKDKSIIGFVGGMGLNTAFRIHFAGSGEKPLRVGITKKKEKKEDPERERPVNERGDLHMYIW